MKKKVVAILLCSDGAFACSLRQRSFNGICCNRQCGRMIQRIHGSFGKYSIRDGRNSTDGYADDLSDIIPKDTVTLDVYDQLANYSGEQIGWTAKRSLKTSSMSNWTLFPKQAEPMIHEWSPAIWASLTWGDDSDQYQQAVQKNFALWLGRRKSGIGLYLTSEKYEVCSKNKRFPAANATAWSWRRCQHRWPPELYVRMGSPYDLYKQIGSPEIKNLDDMVDVLAKMKEACPTDDNETRHTACRSLRIGTATWLCSWTDSFRILRLRWIWLRAVWSGKQVYHDALEENGPYLTCLKFYNELYQKGLLDPDSRHRQWRNNGWLSERYCIPQYFQVPGLGSLQYGRSSFRRQGYGAGRADRSDPDSLYQNAFRKQPCLVSIGANTENPESAILPSSTGSSTPEGCLTLSVQPEGNELDSEWRKSFTLQMRARNAKRICLHHERWLCFNRNL